MRKILDIKPKAKALKETDPMPVGVMQGVLMKHMPAMYLLDLKDIKNERLQAYIDKNRKLLEVEAARRKRYFN